MIFYQSPCIALISWMFLFRCGVIAQVTVNGQTFTNGLAIINSPAQNTPFRAGAILPISIEVSGNGILPASALIPESELSTHYSRLSIYMVSSQTNLNITVSTGEDLLNKDKGSVKHLNWRIPPCVSAAQYNLTLYENSYINDEPHLIITPIPIFIDNTDPGRCSDGINNVEPQPQASSPLPQPPFLPGKPVTINTGPLTLGPRSTPPPIIGPTTPLAPSVIVSVVTVTTTKFGLPVTTTFTTTQTTTTAMQTTNNSGFFPVNASGTNRPVNIYPLWWILALWIFPFINRCI